MPKDNQDKYPELWFFAGIVDDEDQACVPEKKTEEIFWLFLDGNDPVTDMELAGDGDVAYFIAKAKRMLFCNL